MENDFEALFDRAMTFDGYAHVGGSTHDAEDLVYRVRAEWIEDRAEGRSLDDLRAALFTECRMLRFDGQAPSPSLLAYLRQLEHRIEGLPPEGERNPWVNLSAGDSPWVLPSDAPHIEAYNETLADDSANFIDLNLLPEPWVGRLDAPVVLLNLNPGASPDDRRWHQDDGLQTAVWRNLAQEPVRWPFYYLNPELERSPGSRWWKKCLKAWTTKQPDPEKFAASVVSYEFHGYHSRSFGLLPITLPSQGWLFARLRERLEADTVVIALRGLRYWKVAVPELGDHDKLFTVKNNRSASVGPGNLSPGGTEAVHEVLGRS